MDLIYLRHGQTDWNIEHRLQGRTDIPLNSVGIEEARSASAILKQYAFDAVYCSPLIRARQTLSYAYPTDGAIYDDRLAEWCFGELEGTSPDRALFLSRWCCGQAPIEGMEQIEDLLKRVSDFYDEVCRRYPDGRVLVVSHGGVSAAMRVAVCGMAEGENLAQYCLPNAKPVLFCSGQAPVLLEEKV